MIAKRALKSSRHQVPGRLRVTSTRNCAARSAALDHVQSRPHLTATVCHDAHVAREQLLQRIAIAGLGCRRECGHELCMPRVDFAGTRRRPGRAPWPSGAHVRACTGGKLPACETEQAPTVWLKARGRIRHPRGVKIDETNVAIILAGLAAVALFAGLMHAVSWAHTFPSRPPPQFTA